MTTRRDFWRALVLPLLHLHLFNCLIMAWRERMVMEEEPRDYSFSSVPMASFLISIQSGLGRNMRSQTTVLWTLMNDYRNDLLVLGGLDLKTGNNHEGGMAAMLTNGFAEKCDQRHVR